MTNMNITVEQVITYLQFRLDDFVEFRKDFGDDDERTIAKFDQMIGAKEMAEVLLQMPVNLQLDGKVTVGF